MRWWDEQVVPRVTDRLLDVGEIHRLRARVCAGLEGEVLEIGFGSGLNVPHYPPAVHRVDAVEPSDVAWHLAGDRRSQTAARVVRTGLDGELLDAPDESYDAALCTFTLCTIPDVDAALREVRRVLRPGGTFHFLEHGLSPDPEVARWQHRLQPVQGRVGGGCHLDRPIAEIVARSGLRVDELETFYGARPRAFGHFFLGTAVKA